LHTAETDEKRRCRERRVGGMVLRIVEIIIVASG